MRPLPPLAPIRGRSYRDRTSPWAVALVVLVAVSLPLALLAIARDAGAAAARGEPVPTTTTAVPASPVAGTPLLSARRLPGVLTGEQETATLLAELEDVAAQLPDTACLAVDVGGGQVFATPDQPLIPASNLKLVTGFAALQALGPDTRFRTTVVAPTPPVAGVVEGDLTVVGGGDPLLATAPYVAVQRRKPEPRTPLEDLADAVVAAGVTRVTGSVVGDDRRYDGERFIPTWPERYRRDFEVGPISALNVNDGFRGFGADNALALDPAEHAAAVLTTLLEERGVTVDGAARSGAAPAAATEVASIESAPVREVVAEMVRESDNNTAEMLLKEVGHQATGQPGTTAAGIAAAQAALEAASVPTDGLVMVDGSGLDRGNAVRCATLMGLLENARLGSDLSAGLPVAGRTGTLRQRFQGTPMEGRLAAKTGALNGVVTLAGFVNVPDRPDITFAYLYNAAGGDGQGLALANALGSAFATYPDDVDLSPYLPRPPLTG